MSSSYGHNSCTTFNYFRSDYNGIEIISRFTVDNFKNAETFYTDSNVREMIERKLNYRPTYTYNSSIEPIASNYYPVTSKISIRDEEQNLQVSVLNERSQGGSSLDEGQLELMVRFCYGSYSSVVRIGFVLI